MSEFTNRRDTGERASNINLVKGEILLDFNWPRWHRFHIDFPIIKLLDAPVYERAPARHICICAIGIRD